MRALWSSLTLRGRAFVAAGATAIGCAIVFGQPALVRVGVLVLVLPIVAAIVVAVRRPDAQVQRSVRPALLRAGETAHVELAATGTRRRAALLVEDNVPYALGSRPRFVLADLERGWERTLTYPVRSELRGQYDLGPLVVRTVDPFGMVERRSSLGDPATVVVTPRVLPLPGVPLSGGWHGAGDHRPQSFATGSAEDVTVREYRRGDDLRRVHWRSSARLGELMVRREEQPWEAHAIVLLDHRSKVHQGRGPASSFEAAVVTAASAIVHLEQHGYSVQFATADGIECDGADAALRRMAVLRMTERGSLDVGWCGDHARGGVVVGAFGRTLDTDQAALRRIRHDAGAALGVVLDVAQWSASAGRLGDAAAAPLATLGWRATAVGPRDRLDLAWQDLGRSPSRTGAS
ncbi:DUF58 domain-containing protein [Nocardioides caeni]|uniref:DUF58 domain-containing protein n=1 Tax=Nocardioides caeni TaxID=574700 RepID=A0A4S8NNP8_9ACTN|nr:DUF58 domain-containing protein [Nocardioides caeni]THV18540.1 DUF58 domain-containing protein [Nocardioides caeni]